MDSNLSYAICPRHSTDLSKIVAHFQNRSDLYFSLPPYDSQNPESLTVAEIYKKISKLRRQYPDFEIKTLPSYEPIDHRLPPGTELEAALAPSFEISAGEPSKIEFSFIIPTYNSKYFLVNVVKHILQQNADPESFEILVVDDGGNDDTGSFLSSFLRNEVGPFNLKYFFWPKPEVRAPDFFRAGLCRNLGAANANGKYLIFLDSDILLPRDFISDLSERFQKHDVIQYVRTHIHPEKSNSHVSFGDVDRKKDLYIEDHKYWNPFFQTDNWSSLPFYWKYTCTYCLAVPKEHFNAVGRFRKSFTSYGFEDTDLGYRLHKKCLKFHLAKNETLHLTPSQSRFSGSSASYQRFIALNKTAKTFFLLNLDLDIYQHFIVYMGGESTLNRKIYKIKKLFRKLFHRA